MTLWKEPPLNPKVSSLSSVWDGDSFIIKHEATGTVILRVAGIAGEVSANLPDNTVAPIKLTTGLGAVSNLPKTSVGATTVLSAVAYARTFLLNLEVTEALADGGGTQSTFEIGTTATANLYLATGALTNGALGLRIPLGGTLAANQPLLVTAVAATGAGTGAIRVTAIAVR